MSWSFPIGRLFGSEIRIHVTFFLLLAWIGIAHYQMGGTQAAIEGVLFICAIFACVVAHEFGHALAARRYGIRTPDITLLPIGGLARLERMPENPRHEIVVALAGPAVNVVIAVVLIAFMNARFDVEALQRLEDPGLSFMVRLASVNIFLVLFNLIPAFPMDGGRVLRALLAFRYTRTEATNLAARIGQALAFVFGFFGLMGNPMLLFIAIFVYLAATAEAQSVGLQDVSRHLGVGDAMITRFEVLGPQSTVSDAAELLLRTTQHEFPVVDGGGRLRGVLTRNAMIRALSGSGPGTSVLEVMDEVPTVALGSRLEAALTLMQGRSSPAVGVLDPGGRLVGYLTSENIGELMMVENAGLGRRPRTPRGPLLPQ
ncbi:site-2 protease family protein [Lutibaculum baratangense]|uniref:Zinc metalloprotease n=1 Tax=Lutibaculum baratangense AMV1 TaxID=631454 RepID=V4RJX7_9HYPH|nr:site-2 protease family protein [Lutibaculum baratangense]ESR25639.1 putative zinc metalloprotease [Lutibaculum baratangense AMV1]